MVVAPKSRGGFKDNFIFNNKDSFNKFTLSVAKSPTIDS